MTFYSECLHKALLLLGRLCSGDQHWAHEVLPFGFGITHRFPWWIEITFIRYNTSRPEAASVLVRRGKSCFVTRNPFRRETISIKGYCTYIRTMKPCKKRSYQSFTEKERCECEPVKIISQHALLSLHWSEKHEEEESYGPIIIARYRPSLHRVCCLIFESSEVYLRRCSNGLREIISCVTLF